MPAVPLTGDAGIEAATSLNTEAYVIHRSLVGLSA
jgi:hypothetical protein